MEMQVKLTNILTNNRTDKDTVVTTTKTYTDPISFMGWLSNQEDMYYNDLFITHQHTVEKCTYDLELPTESRADLYLFKDSFKVSKTSVEMSNTDSLDLTVAIKDFDLLLERVINCLNR